MSGTPILTVKDLGKRYGERIIFEGLTFGLLPGAHIGLIGRNGQGKSTMLKVLAGEEKPTDGVVVPSKGLTIGYVGQEPRLDPNKNVRGNVEEGIQEIKDLLAKFDAVNEKLGTELSDEEMNETLEEQAKLQAELDAKDAWEVDRKLDVAAEALRLPPWDADVNKLSGGEKRRVALCRVLMKHPDLLLLDEPTNHLDAETVSWLENFLRDYTGTIMLVTHDRYFLDHVTKISCELDKGRIRVYEGNYSAYLEAREKLRATDKATQKKRATVLERELEWLRAGVAARTTKNKARITNYHKLLEEYESLDTGEGSMELRLPMAERLGTKVVNAKHLSKAYGDKVLMKDFSFELPQGGIVGVVGPNGMGKTTLIKMILGTEKPDSGSIEIGDTVRFCYVDQGRDTLDPNKTVYEEVSGMNRAGGRDASPNAAADWITIGKKTMPVRQYLAHFLLGGDIQQMKVGKLSGGERNRVQLAKLLKQGGNVLVLDEPTNDLDLETLRVLEEALTSFPGCAIVVTHDRYFLDRIATHIISFEGNGEVVWCEGSWEVYQEQRQRRLAERNATDPSGKGKHRKMLKT
ncbi:MAG TPA: energy-dependent translational throttle protein EttA [Planctomycetota bacterium]|nr:energy-dependent translational throttle protein EttA [Planctomycetota bacterium]